MLITLDHESMAEPILLSTDPTQRVLETDTVLLYGTISRGLTYYFFPMRIKLPDDTDAGPGEMGLEIDNIERTLTEAIRTIFSPVSVKVEIVMDNAPDVVDIEWPEYQLTNVRYDASMITGTLVLDNMMREPFPGLSFSPSTAPGIFI
jgi:hypothetical protein